MSNSISLGSRAGTIVFHKWVPINQIKKMLLYQLKIRDLLIQTFKNNFKQELVKIEIRNSTLRLK